MKPKRIPVPKTAPPTSGEVCRLTYSNCRPDEDPQLYKDRDSVAFSEVASAFFELGYEYRTTVYLYPNDERRLTEFPEFQPSDLLVMTTRPPLKDQGSMASPHRKIIHAANTKLEAVLFEEFFKYFKWCTRQHVELTEHGAGCLRPAERQKWQHVKLYEYYIQNKTYCVAEVQKHFIGPEEKSPDPTHHSSIAFFLRTNRVPGINCDFVASFGMDAYSTLIWNRLIRIRFAEWLVSPRFVVAELIYKNPLPPRPLTPEFNDHGEFVEVRLLT